MYSSSRQAAWGKAPAVEIDPVAASREIIRAGGNVSAAARALGVRTRDLRLFVYMRPELLDAALEAEEQALDAAQAALVDAMRTGEMGRRIRASGILLRMTPAGRRRGFG